MYDIETRRRLAEELVDAFCEEGSWRPEDLAERAAGRLDRRPSWLDRLAGQIGSGESAPADLAAPGSARAARRALVHRVERFLSWDPWAPADEPPPQLVRFPWGEPPAWAPPLDHDWPIARITSVPQLAERLELNDGQLAWLADVRGLERTVTRERLRNYRYRWVPRRSGPPRLIEAPKLRLKEVQRFVLREILSHVPPHDAAHGFTRGRSVAGHAAVHTGTPAVLHLDVRDFFASVPARRVFGIFHTLGYAAPVAHALTGLTTNSTALMAWDALPVAPDPMHVADRFHLGRRLAFPHLPQGAPTSPALANLAAHGLDRRVAGLATRFGLRYTRYADDLVLSGADLRRGARARDVATLVAAIARDEGFVLHPGKTTLRTAARRQLVTGVVVNAHANVPRDEYDRLRATLHRAARDGPGAVQLGDRRRTTVDLRAHLNGRVAWVESLNPGRGARLRAQFDAIDWGLRP